MKRENCLLILGTFSFIPIQTFRGRNNNKNKGAMQQLQKILIENFIRIT